MRRGKEMYPSFDTRRVLCKQHRPYCVKPMRARLKPSNVNAVAPLLSASKGNDFVAIVQVTAYATGTGKERRSEKRLFALIAKPLLSQNRAEGFAKIADYAAEQNTKNEKAKIRNFLRKEGNTKRDTEPLTNTKKASKHTVRLITSAFAKSKEHGMRPITHHQDINARVECAEINTFRASHLGYFAQKVASALIYAKDKSVFIKTQLNREGCKNGNTESETRLISKNTSAAFDQCHTYASCAL
jgi:hypothetical protein